MLSVAIVAKDEEKTIGECIKSVLEIANEVVLVDSGSEDRTVEIAKELGAKVFFREWTDYVQQVNHAISLCKGEWILVLDADEVLTDELRDSIKTCAITLQWQDEQAIKVFFKEQLAVNSREQKT